jgi:hypothetical protein
MIKCIRLWNDVDGKSHFEPGAIDLKSSPPGDLLSPRFSIAGLSFQETERAPELGWRPDVARQLVITLGGELGLTTHDGVFSLRAGDILFTEGAVGPGHDWVLLGDQPWRRLCAVLDPATVVPFRPAELRLVSPTLV